MSIVFTIFITGCILMIASIYIYSKCEDTAYKDTIEKVNFVIGENKRLEKIINGNITTVANNNLRTDNLVKQFEVIVKECETLDHQIGELKAFCQKLKEAQLSADKTSSVNFQNPLVVQVVETQAKKTRQK